MDFIHRQVATLERQLSWVKTEPIDWLKLSIYSTWAISVFLVYLTLRQYSYFSKKEPPAVLAEHFKPDEFRKSQEYGKAKARLSMFREIYSTAWGTYLLYSGFYPKAWDWAGAIVTKLGYPPVDYEIPQSIVWTFLGMGLPSFTTLPLDIYGTFVIEQRFGFNKTTPALFIKDLLLSTLLSVVIGSPFMAAFLYIFRWAGDRFIPWLMGFMLSFQVIFIMLYPAFIQPLFNKLTSLKDGDLRKRIEVLAAKLKFPLHELYEIDGSKRSSHSNAYFMGLPWKKHIVVFDTLLKWNKPENIEAVVAHELGHWYYQHPTKLLVISQVHLFAILAVFPAFQHSPMVPRSFGFSPAVSANPPTVIAFLLYSQIISPTETVVGMLMNALSRKFEWDADAFAARLPDRLAAKGEDATGTQDMGQRLVSGLIELHVSNLATVWVDWLYSAYHYSHPTLLERIQALDAIHAERSRKRKGKEKEL